MSDGEGVEGELRILLAESKALEERLRKVERELEEKEEQLQCAEGKLERANSLVQEMELQPYTDHDNNSTSGRRDQRVHSSDALHSPVAQQRGGSTASDVLAREFRRWCSEAQEIIGRLRQMCESLSIRENGLQQRDSRAKEQAASHATSELLRTSPGGHRRDSELEAELERARQRILRSDDLPWFELARSQELRDEQRAVEGWTFDIRGSRRSSAANRDSPRSPQWELGRTRSGWEWWQSRMEARCSGAEATLQRFNDAGFEEILGSAVEAAVIEDAADPISFIAARLALVRHAGTGHGEAIIDGASRFNLHSALELLRANSASSKATAAEIERFCTTEESRAAAVDGLRAFCRQAQTAVHRAGQAIEHMQAARQFTDRKSHLQTLGEVVGPPPTDRSWHDEWPALTLQLMRTLDPANATEEWVEKNANLALERRKLRSEVEELLSAGWPADDAETYALLSCRRGPMGRALQQRQPDFAASTYALCAALWRWHRHNNAVIPRYLYRHLTGKFSLTADNEAWTRLESSDDEGFCGVLSAALCKCSCDPLNFDAASRAFAVRLVNTHGVWYEPQPGCDVVAFESSGADAEGEHAAIHVSGNTYCWPPNTIFRLREVVPAGEWTAPAGIRPLCRLLIVSGTYLRPSATTADSPPAACKFHSLEYADRSAYVAGIKELLERPALTMAQEFDREELVGEWVDHHGDRYTLREEWAYVTGPAVPKWTRSGLRDGQHAGKTAEDLLAEANDIIRQQRAAAAASAAPGRAPQQVPDTLAYLTLEEVLAIRLYSGPAYTPINNFLRQLARLSGLYQRLFALQVQITFTATVGHLCSAIRKLADAQNLARAGRPFPRLFRGVRGSLKPSFWVPDELGMVCAVDYGFASTSRNQHTPINYMSSEQINVLWELVPQAQTDVAYHMGADIAALSQFEEEEEVVFPPCTMLRVVHRPGLNRSLVSSLQIKRREAVRKGSVDELAELSTSEFQITHEEVDSKTFTRIVVLPSFV